MNKIEIKATLDDTPVEESKGKKGKKKKAKKAKKDAEAKRRESVELDLDMDNDDAMEQTRFAKARRASHAAPVVIEE